MWRQLFGPGDRRAGVHHHHRDRGGCALGQHPYYRKRRPHGPVPAPPAPGPGWAAATAGPTPTSPTPGTRPSPRSPRSGSPPSGSSTEFGSGFKIAMRDLEIRGAGNILGGEQHGHMETVGYDIVCQAPQRGGEPDEGRGTGAPGGPGVPGGCAGPGPYPGRVHRQPAPAAGRVPPHRGGGHPGGGHGCHRRAHRPVRRAPRRGEGPHRRGRCCGAPPPGWASPRCASRGIPSSSTSKRSTCRRWRSLVAALKGGCSSAPAAGPTSASKAGGQGAPGGPLGGAAGHGGGPLPRRLADFTLPAGHPQGIAV